MAVASFRWYNKTMTIETPNKGQALDSSYLLKIINQINTLTDIVNAKPSGNSAVYIRKENAIAETPTSDLLFAANQIRVTNTNSSSTTSQPGQVSFGTTFKNPPIVTATVEVPPGSQINNKAINLYVSDVTTTSAIVTVNFGTVDTTSVLVNVVAVGKKP